MSEREIVCEDLNLALDGLKGEGFRLDAIYPADDPHTALLTREGEAVRVTTHPHAPPPPSVLPPFEPDFVLTGADGASAEGRAGMTYRDLIPGRLGGRYIASHIRIDGGGPVSDWVHFHRIAVQLIYVRHGWVRVVYEDQGDPFVMQAGDVVLQPPEIRHRVLESSPRLEVIEIGCPALHETFADHALELPTGANPARRFGTQRFVHGRAADTPWTQYCGGEAQRTAIADASGGLADLATVRALGSAPLEFPPHGGELMFGFVLDGSATLDYSGSFDLAPADAFVIPPAESWRLLDPTTDFRLLAVTTAKLD